MKLDEIKSRAKSFFEERGLNFHLVDDVGWSAERARLVLKTIGLKTNVIRSDFVPSTESKFLGRKISLPVMPAPLSGIIKAIDKDCFKKIADGSTSSGVIPWIGYPAKREDLYDLKDFVWIIKPLKDRNLIYSEIEYAEKHCIAVGIDLDCSAFECISGNVYTYKFLKPIDYPELKDLASSTKLPFIAKGILSERDYDLAIKAGCEAVVISNRGGRIIDSSVFPLEVLQSIEKMTETGVDSFIRSGDDVFKALAMGADFVLVGRPVVWGLTFPNGVRRVLEFFKSDLETVMHACGVKNVHEITKDLLISL
ncbi:lactate dehydrogenase [Archaeoglobales archaeon ex4484_92]|nr:MAG: lactate dehydrogenase [Archaeoglobales archaeon ex4484_92]